jgi:pyruvate dehydrogenase E2 component (dihydrolipoamide acetyltransferase)
MAAMAQDITVPDLGISKDVEVIDVLVKPGDKIDVDTPLITLETEKATMDVPPRRPGVVKAVALKKGDRVSKGNVIVQVEGSAADGGKEEASCCTPPPVQPAAKARPRRRPYPHLCPAPARQPQAAPAPIVLERLFAGRQPVDSQIRTRARRRSDCGQRQRPEGRVTADDVKGWVKQALKSGTPTTGGGALPKVPEVDFAKFGPVEVKPLGRIQKISGPRLQASWLNVPHVWQMDEADITDLEETRNKLKGEASKAGVKLTPLAFILRACVKALREFPMVNSSLDASGQNLVWKKYVHLGFAADTPNGLVMPVIRDADKKMLRAGARVGGPFGESARRKADRARNARCQLHGVEPWRHRRHIVHADHQRARSRHSRRRAIEHAAGLQGRTVRAAADSAVHARVRSPRDRRRRWRAFHHVPRREAR